MNRSLRESLVGGRNIPAESQHRRGRSLIGTRRNTDENLDLFSKNPRTLSVASSDESDASAKLGMVSVGSAKLAKSGIDDLLSSIDGGKHDYDWLLTPPGTPLDPSSEGSDFQTTIAAPRSSSIVKPVSTTKVSRLSATESESNHLSRPARTSLVNRSSISSTQYSNTYSSNRSSSVLNTSSASVSSYIRPSSPSKRSPSTARPSTSSGRSTPSRPSTPSKARPTPNSCSIDKTRPSQHYSRPSTPSSRPQIMQNLPNPASRSNSRPATPTRRNPAPSLSSPVSLSASVGRVLTNGRNPAPSSRPSSPGPRGRATQQPIIPPDYPLETPPNLRTTLPDRPVSAGRSRPGIAVTVKGNAENLGPVNVQRRQSSPVITRGRLIDTASRGHEHTNGHDEARKVSQISEIAMRKPVRTSTTTSESTGFGRSISKKSLDMAIRHMDIRNGTGGMRPLPGTTLFPQSIRTATSKTQYVCAPNTAQSTYVNGSLPASNGRISSGNVNYHNGLQAEGIEEGDCRISAKLREVDIYESSRYDAILLKEDLKNTNWLHSADDKFDQVHMFDHGFEPPPEPFGLL